MLPKRKTRARAKPPPDRVRSPGHLAWVRRNFICAVADKRPGDYCKGTTQTHHVKTRGAGGGDDQVVPLCCLHHAKIHSMGVETFGEHYGENLPKMAADLWQADQYHRIAYERKKDPTP